MEIRNGLDSLKSLLGVDAATTAQVGNTKQNTQTPSAETGALGSDSATVSSAASQVAETASASEVRAEKVDSVHAALAAGTYNVPASAVATKVVDAMLSNV